MRLTKKIAIVHEWFTAIGGSEKVVEQLLQVFPDADLFGLIDFLPALDRGLLDSRPVRTSFLQRAPFINANNYRSYLALMPLAIEQLDLSAYDLIISSCHAVSKGVITGPDQLHISYIHTPMRYAWDMQSAYLESGAMLGIKGLVARLLLHYIRIWDVGAANRPDVLIANSSFIARRIRKVYRRASTVIHPGVDTEYFTPQGPREDFYFTASRFVPYKRLDLIIDSFRGLPDKRLVIIGDGPELDRYQGRLPANISCLGTQPASVLRDHLRRCRAFIFAAREDFGILPVEAQASGAPVIAFGQGGVVDTVRGQGNSNQTGFFFQAQTVAALSQAILDFDNQVIHAEDCRTQAEKFSSLRFRGEISKFVERAWADFQRV